MKIKAGSFFKRPAAWGWACFAVVLIIYVFTASRTVPPYRDSGELIVASATLSIAHSPGYPVYMILGKAAVETGRIMGLNAAFSMNLLSALCGALAVLFLFFFIYELTSSRAGAAFGSLAAGLAYMNWYLSVVAEMYSLNLMFIAALLLLAVKRKYAAAAFTAGLTLGNHLTAVFAILPVAFCAWVGERRKINIGQITGFFMLGVSVYLYHLLRSASGPYINWGDPSTFRSLVRVVTRAAYGHTLDLVSREVTLGQVFLPHLKRFFVHIYRDMSVFVLIMSAAGILSALGSKGKIKNYSIGLLFMFMLTGPFFLYMAKMPINPHASAIVEVGYMIPEMVLAIFAGIFLALLIKKASEKAAHVSLLYIIAIFIIFNLFRTNLDKADHSSNFFARDYAVNVLESAEKNAFVLMRRDHPVFSLWYMRDIENIRQDVRVIALGLVSASWYREKLLKDFPDADLPRQYSDDVRYVMELISLNEGSSHVYMTDTAAAELGREFHDRFILKPWGLVNKAYRRVNEDTYDPYSVLRIMEEEYIYSGDFDAGGHYDYFTKDFISQYAGAYDRLGSEFFREGNTDKAIGMHYRAVGIDPLLWRGWSNLAYVSFQQGDLKSAAAYYSQAARRATQYMNMYTRRDFFKPSVAGLFNSLGAVYERKYRESRNEEHFVRALENYNKALELKPDFTQAYYNIGVLYWIRGYWNEVVKNFRIALRHNPDNAEIQRYLNIAERNLQ